MAEARTGSSEALGRLLMGCRDYLLLMANRSLAPELRAKVNPSDVVQDTFLEAHRDFERFHGERLDELLAWLTHLLANNMANLTRHYLHARKRDVHREVQLSEGEVKARLEAVLDTPSAVAIAGEEEKALAAAKARLPESYRQVLDLRYNKQQTFAQIGLTLTCSAEAARKLWARAVHRLQRELDRLDES
jgi:RNA polymerase sigma-70 factor (ECF subfamily)